MTQMIEMKGADYVAAWPHGIARKFGLSVEYVATAINTMFATASSTTTRGCDPATMSLTTRPARTGVATARSAETTLNSRNTPILRRCGAAKRRIRRAVSARSGLRSSGAWACRYI
ncbi:hypothetical protein, partial [Nocardia farcinica]|uniref:hypothetical protein n=1 Tax=Nocardia farcinica TaxID=37329 RepID=UPI003D7A69E3